MQDAIPLSQRARVSSPASILQGLTHVLPQEDKEAVFLQVWCVPHFVYGHKTEFRLLSVKKTEGDTTQ